MLRSISCAEIGVAGVYAEEPIGALARKLAATIAEKAWM